MISFLSYRILNNNYHQQSNILQTLMQRSKMYAWIKSPSLKTQSYIANAIYIAVAFIINANNNSNFVLFLSITFYPITFYPITTQTLTIMIIVNIVKSEG